MQQCKVVLFDLDGTLTDPGLGITNSVMYALDQYGIKVEDRRSLYPFIGPPLWESFEKFYGFGKAQAQEAVGFYREYFAENGIFENKLYKGIPELLEKLQNSGKVLLLATSKPQVFAEKILEHFDLVKYFNFTAGSELDGSRVKKAAVIAYALENAGCTDTTKAVMVGDREHDVLGAKAHGIPCIGVLFGYGDKNELETAGAAAFAATPAEIGNLLLAAPI